MAGILDVKYKHWHTLLINIILFIVIFLVYEYGGIEEPKHMPICLMGTYIGLNAFLTFGHEFYHSHTEKKNSVHPEKKD